MTDASLLGILVAALGGAAIGVERQQSGHATGIDARFAGVRTFTLLGGVAGLTGWLTRMDLAGMALVIEAGAVAVVVIGYVAASRRDVDATTEVAALIVIAAGFIAGIGYLALASGTVAMCALLLVEKSRLHALVAGIDDDELRAGARFAVMAVVVLPLLPEGPFGPLGGIKPRELWLLVLFFAGLSFCGYVARRLIGPGRGYAVAGVLGGFISSTNVTFTFARLSRHENGFARALATGAVGASTMLFPRVALAAAVLRPTTARALLPYLIAPFVLGAIATASSWRLAAPDGDPNAGPSNPLQVWAALQMAALFQVVLFAVYVVRHYFSEGGLLASGAVLGLTDVDALTVSMTRVAADSGADAIASKAIAIGIVANCVLKAGLAAALGAPAFRRLAGSVLLAMALTITMSLVWR
ncbi:MAG TPA: MgtC/SapB family protein [Vicinamibacterales bacterium]|jgi:uncharacterized membrane protein (DUF4010 family)